MSKYGLQPESINKSMYTNNLGSTAPFPSFQTHSTRDSAQYKNNYNTFIVIFKCITRQPTCLSIVWFRSHRSKVSEKVTAPFFCIVLFKKITIPPPQKIFGLNPPTSPPLWKF